MFEFAFIVLFVLCLGIGAWLVESPFCVRILTRGRAWYRRRRMYLAHSSFTTAQAWKYFGHQPRRVKG